MNCIIILGKVTFFEIFLTKKVLKKKFENKLPAEKSNLKIVILKPGIHYYFFTEREVSEISDRRF